MGTRLHTSKPHSFILVFTEYTDHRPGTILRVVPVLGGPEEDHRGHVAAVGKSGWSEFERRCI